MPREITLLLHQRGSNTRKVNVGKINRIRKSIRSRSKYPMALWHTFDLDNMWSYGAFTFTRNTICSQSVKFPGTLFKFLLTEQWVVSP